MLIEWLDIIAPAWVAGSLLALLSAPLGCLVLWRRMSFFCRCPSTWHLVWGGLSSAMAATVRHRYCFGQCYGGD